MEENLILFTELNLDTQEEIETIVKSYYSQTSENFIMDYYLTILSKSAMQINKTYFQELEKNDDESWVKIQEAWYNWLQGHYQNEILLEESNSYFHFKRLYNYKINKGLDMNTEDQWRTVFEYFLNYGNLVQKRFEICKNDLGVLALTLYKDPPVGYGDEIQVIWFNYIRGNYPELDMSDVNLPYFNYATLKNIIENQKPSNLEELRTAVNLAISQTIGRYLFPEQFINYINIDANKIDLENSDIQQLISKYQIDILPKKWKNYWEDVKKNTDENLQYPEWQVIIGNSLADSLNFLKSTEWYFSKEAEFKPQTKFNSHIEDNFKFEIMDFGKDSITWRLINLDPNYDRNDRRTWIQLYSKNDNGEYNPLSYNTIGGRNSKLELINDFGPAFVKEINVSQSEETFSQGFKENLKDQRYLVKCCVAHSYGKLSEVLSEDYFLFNDLVGERDNCVWTLRDYQNNNFYVGLPNEEVINYMYKDFNYQLVDIIIMDQNLTFDLFISKYKQVCLSQKYYKEYSHYFPYYQPWEMWCALQTIKQTAKFYVNNVYNHMVEYIVTQDGHSGEYRWKYQNGKWEDEEKFSGWAYFEEHNKIMEITTFKNFASYLQSTYDANIFLDKDIGYPKILDYYMKALIKYIGLDPIRGYQVEEFALGRIYNPTTFEYKGKDETKEEGPILDTSKWLDLTSYEVITGSSQYKALFPPILESSQPAFTKKDNDNYTIYFKLSDYTNFEEVGHVDLRIVKQSNNATAVNTRYWYDGIIYIPHQQIKSYGNGLYGVTIKTTNKKSRMADLAYGHWEENTYYKVQARIGISYSLWTNNKSMDNKEQYVEWRNNETSNGRFSDWSTVMILKTISKPTVKILNKEDYFSNFKLQNTYWLEYTDSPVFHGQYSFENKKNDIELLDSYKFILYFNNEIIEDSGWISYARSTTGVENSVTLSHRFNTTLILNENYRVEFHIKTVNGYENFDFYEFKTQETVLDYFKDIQGVKLEAIQNEEEGIISLQFSSGYFIDNHIRTPNGISGNFIITRKRIGEEIWEDLHYFIPPYPNYIYENEIIFSDFTIENGIEYQYGIQKEYNNKIRSSRVISNREVCNFEHCYLYSNDKQLKIKYDVTLSSFKHTVLSNKQDTLGGKYPIILRNGMAYYTEFPIQGTITMHSDENFNFLTKTSQGLKYNDELIIPYTKYYHISPETDPQLNRIERGERDEIQGQDEFLGVNTFNTDLTANNIFIERKFREKVEHFLNDGQPKLFKSPTEGNILVSLINISLTPKKELGRAIYSFSAQAYEIADNSLDSLIKYKILNTGNFQLNFNSGYTLGQIRGNCEAKINLFSEIENSIAERPSDDAHLVLKSIKKFQLEHYPKINLFNDIQKIEFEVRKDQYDTISRLQLKEQQKQLEELQNKLNSTKQYEPYEIELNNNNLILLGNKPYITKDKDYNSSDSLKILSKETSSAQLDTVPIINTYIAEVNYEEMNTSILINALGSTSMSQLNAYMVKPNSLLSKQIFDYDFKNKLYPIFEYIDQQNNYFYNSWNIFEILRYRLKREIAKRLQISDKEMEEIQPEAEALLDLNLPVWKYTNNKQVFLISLANIDSLKISGITGTSLTYKNKQGEKFNYVIGSTGTLNLEPIAFEVFYENNDMVLEENILNGGMPNNQDIVPITIDMIYTLNIIKLGV